MKISASIAATPVVNGANTDDGKLALCLDSSCAFWHRERTIYGGGF
jgi:hypothetical protein